MPSGSPAGPNTVRPPGAPAESAVAAGAADQGRGKLAAARAAVKPPEPLRPVHGRNAGRIASSAAAASRYQANAASEWRAR